MDRSFGIYFSSFFSITNMRRIGDKDLQNLEGEKLFEAKDARDVSRKFMVPALQA